jgi:hypothetical protein
MMHAIIKDGVVETLSQAGPRGPEWVAVPDHIGPGWALDGGQFAPVPLDAGALPDPMAPGFEIVGGTWRDTGPERIAAQTVPPIRATRLQLIRELRRRGLADAFAAGLQDMPPDAQQDWGLAVDISSADPLALIMAGALGVDVLDLFLEATK